MSNPKECLIEDHMYPVCEKGCMKTANNPKYPPYDPRCRSWYQTALRKSNQYDSAYEKYMYFIPRKSINNDSVITVVAPIRNRHKSLLGVLISNYYSHRIQEAFNNLNILKSGYVFLIDKNKTTNIIIHPHASWTCIRVECAMRFNSYTEEYNSFKKDVLDPIQESIAPNNISRINGRLWWLDYTDVTIEKEVYVLIAVVPYIEVIEASQKTDNSITKAVTIMIVLFVISTALFLIFFVIFVQRLITYVVDPVNDLRKLCMLIKNDDLDVNIPTKSTSLDMKILLSAFSNLLIALRFGSDSYVRGDNKRARKVFTEALELFIGSENQRGIGSSMNNLAAVELCDGNYNEAEELYLKSIENATKLYDTEHEVASKIKINRIISDRKGNLVIVYLRQQDNLEKAYGILREVLLEDKRNNYFRGCVVKQGTLGQYYLRKKDFHLAQRVLESCLIFSRETYVEVSDGVEWNKNEAEVAQQIALYNMAHLHISQYRSFHLMESSLLEALCSTKTMHLQTTRSILSELFDLLTKHSRNCKDEIKQLASDFDFKLMEVKMIAPAVPVKRIMFAIDYSRSMEGEKINSAIANLRNIFACHVNSNDEIGLLGFNTTVQLILRLSKKGGNEDVIESSFEKLLQVRGKTALYDAIKRSFAQFPYRDDSSTDKYNDWVVVLTDGMLFDN